jgi:hypothetical protein
MDTIYLTAIGYYRKAVNYKGRAATFFIKTCKSCIKKIASSKTRIYFRSRSQMFELHTQTAVTAVERFFMARTIVKTQNNHPYPTSEK